MKWFLSLWVVLFLIPASGAMGWISYKETVPMTPTDWTMPLSFPKFDPSLGTLNTIEFNWFATTNNTAAFENESDSVGWVDLYAIVKYELHRPDMSILQSTYCTWTEILDVVLPYDGTTDFGGSSGETFSDQTGYVSDFFALNSPSDLALFTGIGTIELPLIATDFSFINGSNNIVFDFQTAASYEATIYYGYTVPEPSSSLILGLGVFFLKKRRLSQNI